MVELLDKSLRISIIKMLQPALKNLLERNEKNSLCKEIEDIKFS